MASRKSKESRKKLVVVGDGFCGKTCLLLTYCSGEFPSVYVPTIFETYATTIQTPEGQGVHMLLCDTAGQEDYDRLRIQTYYDADVIILCYCVDRRASYLNVSNVWLPELRRYAPRVPILLVACKADLPLPSLEEIEAKKQQWTDLTASVDSNKEGDGHRQVSKEEGAIMASVCRLSGFVECSAKTQAGVQNVFRLAARLALKRRLCAIL